MTTTSFQIHSHETAGNPLATFATWLSRAVLFFPMIIMVSIGIRCIGDPVHALASSGVALTTPEAFTDTRVVGALAFTLAIVIGTSLASSRGLRRGHGIVIALMALILVIRMFGFAHDGTTLATGGQRFKTAGEILFLLLNTLALILQTRLHRSREVNS